MKRIFIIILAISICDHSWSQTNTFPSTGGVGIGTLSPSQLLDVRGHIYTTGSVFIDGGDLVLKRTSNAYGYVARPNTTGYKKLAFAVEGGGALEEFYVNSNQSIFTGMVNAGDSYDGTPYGYLQLTRPTDQGDNKFHLSLIRAGYSVSGMGYARNSNVLGIWHGNDNSETPLMSFTYDQKVGIGTSNPQAKLAVNGDIYSTKVKVTQNGWSDYVFDNNYKLSTIAEVEKYIQQFKHLPHIPSANDVEENGLDIGDNQALLLKKIEELMLYMIEQNKINQKQETKIQSLENEIKKLKGHKK